MGVRADTTFRLHGLSDYANEAGLLLLLQLLLRLPPRQDYSQTARLHNHEVKDDCTAEADVTTVLPTEYWDFGQTYWNIP